MEIFVQGVPERAKKSQLSEFLLSFMNDLSIENWQCQKNKNKNFAHLTFLSHTDGTKFLEKHGSQHRNNAYISSPLIFQGRPLKCSPDKKPPDKFALRHLEMNAKSGETMAARNRKRQASSEVNNKSTECSSVFCGNWDYTGSTLFLTVHTQWHSRGQIKFGSKVAIIKLNTGQQIDIPYSTILDITTEGMPHPAMTITLNEAPQFFQDINSSFVDSSNDFAKLMDLLSLNTKQLQKEQSRQRTSGLDSYHEKISGSCLVFRIGLMNSDLPKQVDHLSRNHEIPSPTWQRIPLYEPRNPFEVEMAALLKELAKPDIGIPFTVLFQVQKLAQNGYLLPSKVLSLVPEIKLLASQSKVDVCVDAIRNLFQQIPYSGPDIEAQEFQLDTLRSLLKDNAERLKDGNRFFDEVIESENVVNIHRVTVTPAGIYLYGPEPESNNRVLRKYPKHHDYFIRVQFSDEDGSPIRYNPKASNTPIYSRFKKILDEGIGIAGRQFKFLGFSHSSLRAQSCWFMAAFVHNGSLLHDRMLIKGLGDFTHIQCPAKCAARIGQAFSDTPTAVTLAPGVIKTMKDIERNDRKFSDGVGTISASLLEKICDVLPRARWNRPTILQIRCLGAKGMVALDSRLDGDCLYLRDSMIKFDASDSTNDIEICGAAYRPLPLYLNQQMIKILEDMGVDNNFFLDQQAKEVKRLRDITSSSINASTFLRTQGVGEIVHIPWFIERISDLKLSFQGDDFLRDILEITVLIELRKLKHKARIPIQKGYTLHGIMDETGAIKEGEVFCIVEVDGKPKIITGKNLIITRSPALHKGDIQLVTAVNVSNDSPLMQLRNCICFSQHGPRDLPSKLSGGDLDGDLYNIIFDPKAQVKRVFEPADYPAQFPVNLGREVTREDMTDFFVTFMETDQLGRIANLHKILADQKDDGVLNGDCLKLAEMHSQAVDFSKSGVPVNMREIPRDNKYRPDFMAPGPHVTVQQNKPISFYEKDENVDADDEDDSPPHRYYTSNKILGKLYRAIDERKIFEDVQQRNASHNLYPAAKNCNCSNSLLENVWEFVQKKCRLISWDQHLDLARAIRDDYESIILSIESEYSRQHSRPISELEVFAGNILGKTGAPSHRQQDLSKSMKERFDEELTYFAKSIVGDARDVGTEDSVARSMAAFEVALEEEKGGRRRGDRRGRREAGRSFGYVAASLALWGIDKWYQRY